MIREIVIGGSLMLSVFFSFLISYSWIFSGGMITLVEPNIFIRAIEPIFFPIVTLYSYVSYLKTVKKQQ